MEYNLSVIQTVETCDFMIARETKVRNKLAARRMQREASATNGANQALNYPALMASMDAEIAALQAELATTTDADELLLLQADIYGVHEDRARLEIRSNSFSDQDQARDQYSVAKLAAMVDAAEEFIAALEARKTAILSGEGETG